MNHSKSAPQFTLFRRAFKKNNFYKILWLNSVNPMMACKVSLCDSYNVSNSFCLFDTGDQFGYKTRIQCITDDRKTESSILTDKPKSPKYLGIVQKSVLTSMI